jgi:hypothetical protein
MALGLLALFPQAALAVKRGVVRDLQSEYAGHTYQLRMDLRGTDYFAAFNVVNEQGIHYRGRELPIIFYQLETVYLDRVSNEGGKEVRLTIYRSRNDARQIRGSVPAAPLPVGPDRDTTLGNFARDLSTNVLLEVRAGKDDPDAQRSEITALLERLFYLKETPGYKEKEEFVLSHPDLPIPRLAAITGLAEDLVNGILKRREAAKPW